MTRAPDLEAAFITAFAAVPAALRKEIITIVNGQPYTWEAAYVEITRKTKIGDEILKQLERLKVIGDEA